MATVRMIPARPAVGARKKTENAPKIRVAAYCRVSTDTDEQATSYDAQIEHYTDLIAKHPEWELAGIYADDGISGTNTKKREEFNRLIDDCMAGRVDMVISKSISRFARNTLDCLKYIRQLKEKNIAVFFEKEAINTLDAKGEVLLTIMACSRRARAFPKTFGWGFSTATSKARCRSARTGSSVMTKTRKATWSSIRKRLRW